MRAVRCHSLTGPSSLQVDEIPAPTPGAGEVAIDVRAAGVNFPDVLLSYGKYQFKPACPFIPGGEVAGVVSAVGDGVTTLAVGDRVAATLLYGAFAEAIVVPEMAAVKLPEAVGFEVGAATLLTYATTWHALVDRANLRAGETLLVLGAAGGVGLAAVEIGKLLGARVIAAASSPEKLAVCREHGADEGIDYAREDLKERVKALTGGAGADVVYDPVGGAFTEAALRATAWEGRLLIVGFAAGEIPKVPMNLVLLKGCQIAGVFWGSFAMREPEKNRANCARILDHVARGELRPRVDAVLPFTRAGESLERLERREVKGKLVLVPEAVTTLYRPVGPQELALLDASGRTRFPPRLADQPIFYPVCNERYAREIAERWNVQSSGSGYVTRFAVRDDFLARYERHTVGARHHEEYWIPAEELAAFNAAIVGPIEVIATYTPATTAS